MDVRYGTAWHLLTDVAFNLWPSRPQLEEAKPPLCPVSAWSKELWGCNPEIACSLLVNNKQRCSKPKKKNNGSIISHVSQAHDDLFIVRSVYTHITITLKVSLSLSPSHTYIHIHVHILIKLKMNEKHIKCRLGNTDYKSYGMTVSFID